MTPDVSTPKPRLVRVPELLVEAAACAPLSGTELRILLFMMRRVFGTGKKKAQKEYIYDICTQEEISKAIGLPYGTVRNAIATLQKADVLKSVVVAGNGPRAYGINVCVDEWGAGNRGWAEHKPALYGAQDGGLFKFNVGVTGPLPTEPDAIVGLPEIVTPSVTKSGRPVSSIREGEIETEPDAPTPEPVSAVAETDNAATTQKSVDETVEELIGEPEDPDDFELQSPPDEPKPKSAEKLNEEEIDATTDALFARMDPTLREAIEAYLLFMASKRVYKHISPSLRWKTVTALCKLAKEPGITPENVMYGVEAAMGRDAENTNYVASAARSEALKQQGQASRAGAPPSVRFIQLENGGRTMEKDWSMGQKMLVELETSKQNWNAATGCTKERTIGFCCDDGKFYGSGVDPTRWK